MMRTLLRLLAALCAFYGVYLYVDPGAQGKAPGSDTFLADVRLAGPTFGLLFALVGIIAFVIVDDRSTWIKALVQEQIGFYLLMALFLFYAASSWAITIFYAGQVGRALVWTMIVIVLAVVWWYYRRTLYLHSLLNAIRDDLRMPRSVPLARLRRQGASPPLPLTTSTVAPGQIVDADEASLTPPRPSPSDEPDQEPS